MPSHVEPGLAEAVADSQIASHFTVDVDDPLVIVADKGTRPRGPLADLIFVMVFAMSHADLCSALECQGL